MAMPGSPRIVPALLLAAGTLGVVAWVSLSGSATYAVTSMEDSGPGSLREAVGLANANPGHDTVELPAGTLEVTSAALVVTSDLTIVGRGPTTTVVAGDGTVRLLDVGSGASLEVRGVTLRGGDAGGETGGAIRAAPGGALTITAATVVGNSARHGGAVAVSGRTVAITDSTFADNAAVGGGALVADRSDLTITDSTFAGSVEGGALWLDPASTVELVHTTIAGYRTTDRGSLLSIGRSTIAIRNTVFRGTASPGTASSDAAGGDAGDDAGEVGGVPDGR